MLWWMLTHMRRSSAARAASMLAAILFAVAESLGAQRYGDANGHVRVALVKQPFLPNGTSQGPTTMAEGGIQVILARAGATVRVSEVQLTAQQDTEYGGWKRFSMALGQH